MEMCIQRVGTEQHMRAALILVTLIIPSLKTQDNDVVTEKWQARWSFFLRAMAREANKFEWKKFKNKRLGRIFYFMSSLSTASLPKLDQIKFSELLSSMKEVYAKARVCPYAGSQNSLISQRRQYCNNPLALELDIVNIMASSRDPDELQYYWKAWRNASKYGNRVKYVEIVKLLNEAAKLNGFEDASQEWLTFYEDKNFENELDQLWVDSILPLYQRLHAYVRGKLGQYYGIKFMEDSPIPAHLLGDMWGQTWANIFDISVPYPEHATRIFNVAEFGLTSLDMIGLAEAFFVSLGLEALPLSFWKESVFSRSNDSEVICAPSAWDFCNGKDYRIKQCTIKSTMENLLTTHHEIGHIYYSLLYKNQPLVFREGANPGFHEAVGDTIGLSVSSPTYWKITRIQSEDVKWSYETDINNLFLIALDKIAFLPFGLLVDKWRWSVFKGEIKENELNEKWWDLRLKLQGVNPPVLRSEEDFDPGAKYHIAANMPYVRYFVGLILQFQIHKSLCEEVGYSGPLFKCSIYGHRKAGHLLRKALSLGRSVKWQEVFSILTNGRYTKLDASAILEFFEPLDLWLRNVTCKEENTGWSTENVYMHRGYFSVPQMSLLLILFGSIFIVLLPFLLWLMAVRLKRVFNSLDL